MIWFGVEGGTNWGERKNIYIRFEEIYIWIGSAINYGGLGLGRIGLYVWVWEGYSVFTILL